MKFGWIPDVPDYRDFMLSLPPLTAALPPAYALQAPFVFDQGNLGSCTANAISTLYEMTQLEKAGALKVAPSRLALYYWARLDQGTPNQDSGASIRGAIKAAAQHGMCREETWPYVVAKFKQRPGPKAREEASKHRMTDTAYARVPQTETGIKQCILENNPIAFGFAVYQSFMSDAVRQTGMVPMPAPKEKMLGGHAVTIIGWDDSKKCFLIKNSWGSNWGQHGNCWMPYDFILNKNICDDFWTIYKVTPL